MPGNGIMHFKAGETTGVGRRRGEESRRTSKSSGGERALNGTRLGSWCRQTKGGVQKHTCRHRGLISGANKKPAESPARNGFHLAFPIDGPPGCFRRLCSMWRWQPNQHYKTARSNHTAGAEGFNAECEKCCYFFFPFCCSGC